MAAKKSIVYVHRLLCLAGSASEIEVQLNELARNGWQVECTRINQSGNVIIFNGLAKREA